MSAEEKRRRIQADLVALRPLDHGDIGYFGQRLYRVGKYSTITVEGVHYSVPNRGLQHLSSEQIQAQMISAKGAGQPQHAVGTPDSPDPQQAEIESSASHTLDMLSSFMECARPLHAN